MVILLCWEQRGSCRERFRAKVLDENAGEIYRLYSCILETCFYVALVAPCEGSTAMEAAHLNLVPFGLTGQRLLLFTDLRYEILNIYFW